MSAIIKTEHLCYSYHTEENKKVQAVNDVSIEIEEGQFVAILGHNGSGKSTFAKLLNMILTPESGKIFIDGKELTSPDITEDDIYDIRRQIGMVFQNPDNQIVATIVEEDVAFGPENLGIPSDEIRKRVDNALETVGMKKYARHAPHKLSGGQKQRVAIAGIIAMMPRCIIFDESTAMLDPLGRREVMDTIERLNRKDGKTVLHITHYMGEATRADRVIVMRHGSVYMDGTPKEIFTRVDELWEAGLEVPQTTEFMHGLNELGLSLPLDIFETEPCAEKSAEAILKWISDHK